MFKVKGSSNTSSSILATHPGDDEIPSFHIHAENMIVLFDGSIHFGNVKPIAEHFLDGIGKKLAVSLDFP